ncbi:hypothetical protein Hanom_Chr09g00832511 [Helianthus anomalus]
MIPARRDRGLQVTIAPGTAICSHTTDIGFRRCFLTVKRKWNWSKLGRCSTEQNHVAAVVTTSYNIGSCLL